MTAVVGAPPIPTQATPPTQAPTHPAPTHPAPTPGAHPATPAPTPAPTPTAPTLTITHEVGAPEWVDGEWVGVDTPPLALDWRELALCAQTDPDSFFPEKGGSTREAKRVCLSCEVRVECLEFALGNDERFGIWGGLSERERRRLKQNAV